VVGYADQIFICWNAVNIEVDLSQSKHVLLISTAPL